jgi:hypothetical protein
MILQTKISILIPLLLTVFISSAQQQTLQINKKTNNNHKKMKELALKEIKLVESQQPYQPVEYIQNDSIYELVKKDNALIVKTSSKLNENLRKIEVYNSTTKLLKSEGYLFGDMSIGQHTEYDIKGDVVRTINYDEKYKVTINDFTDLILNKTGVDLTLKTNNIMDMVRSYDNSIDIPFYSVMLYISENSIRIIKVNANTGEIYYDAVTPMIED